MTEHIELQSYCINNDSMCDNPIEEYHEIDQDVSHESPFSFVYSNRCVKEYDFFTQNDVKVEGKYKEKKNHNKEKASNIMDLICSELATAPVPIATNVLIIEKNMEYQQNSCLSQVSSICTIFNRSLRTDQSYKSRNAYYTVNISPIFPRVLNNVDAIDGEANIPVQYVEPTMFKNIIESDENYDRASKFLDIVVKNLRFKHHHKFSLEKLLCIKLIDLYDEYVITQNLIEDLLRDVRVSRETTENLKKDLLKVSQNKRDDLRFDKTIRKYTDKLIQSKEKLTEALRKKDNLIHNMMSLWADIETIREKSGHILTPYILDVTTVAMDDKKIQNEWHKLFDTEFSDLIFKMEYEYVTKYLEYKEIKNNQNMEFSRRKKIVKPKLEIQEETLKEQVEVIVNDIVRKSLINVILRKDDNILSKTVKSDDNKFQNTYSFQIFVDDTFVCDSENYIFSGTDTDELEFNESISIQILPHNTTLMIVLLENNEKVSFGKISLTNIRKNGKGCDFTSEIFIYNTVVEPTLNTIGSGHDIKEITKINNIRLKSSNLFEGSLYTKCEINYKVKWNEKLNKNHSESIRELLRIKRNLIRLLHGIEKPNIDVLANMIGQIYGQDVDNDERIISILRNVCKQTIYNVNDSFPVPDENSSEYIRFKLLHLRNIGGFINVENKTVPLQGRQISTDQLKCLQKIDDKDFDIEYINSKYIDADPIELQRFVGAKYVQKLNKNMLKNLNEHLLKKTHKDVVHDFQDLSLKSFLSNQTNLPDLAKMSDGTKQQLLMESLGSEQEICVTIHKAYNLMDRLEEVIAVDNDEVDRIAGFKVRPLRPLVRVSYRGETLHTTTAIGCNPTWNQTLKMKAKPEPLSLISVNVYDEYKASIREGHSGDDLGRTVHYRYYHKWLGTLQIPLYSVLTTGFLHGTLKLFSPPLLFGYELPSQTADTYSLLPGVIQRMKKDMSFISLQITTTLAHLGGTHSYNQPVPNGPEDDYLIRHLNNFVTEYVNDFPSRNIRLTFIDSTGKNKCVTQFLQPIPLPDNDYFPKNPKNIGSALSKSSGFSGSSSKSSAGRKLDLDLEKGSSQTVNEDESMYSAREDSWRGVENQLAKLVKAGARYVSLIPTYQLVETHVVTLLGLELLRVLHGSPLDHSILLASYFLYLGVRCWVAVGRGLPRGHSTYVLTKYDLTAKRIVLSTDQLFKRRLFSKNDGCLWHVHDASSGEHYELRDVSCPLKTVDYVFDSENIWVNVQSSQDCENMSFDFDKSSNWQPVFDKTVFVMKQPVVMDTSLYSPPADTSKLRQALEDKIRGKMQKWRPHMKTVWNRYCSGLLREQLPAWEYWAFNPGEPRPGFSHKMKQMMVTYRMFGFPLNMPFLNTKAVVSSVKSTRLHMLDDPTAEFGLAVELFCYPNNVISVWVFLACITRI
ncbi:coiled-coil and C2 domain-containing protein 2A [Plodia interpunctella]|uniref:coiled-coil and C2 domain-containing protein 2A n=1 Tax=Plodia interpunctella TaxID=58824 RepID=UPI002367E102|nr:coiled-coil and C2 domain-containing protein 2A [Plodia interpunctella]